MASTMRRMEGTAMAGKFGLDPHQLDDKALERELRHLYATREETFFHGSRQALLNHTERMLQLEREYANRSRNGPRPTSCGPARAPGPRRDSPPVGNRPPVGRASWRDRSITVHPILVGPTEWHHQRKGWIAWRSAVDL